MRLDLEDGSEEKPWTWLEATPWLRDSPFLTWVFTDVLWVLGFGFLIIMLIYDWSADPVPRQEAHARIAQEFAQIRPFPGTRETDRVDFERARSVTFGAKFKSDYGDAQIKAYYETELPRLGWVKRGGRPKWVRARGLGGMRICWVKDDRVAVLQFDDTRGEPEWRYSLTMTWGQEQCP